MIFLEKIKLYIPGVLVCAAIALGCTFLGQAFPLIGGPVFGILAGMAIALVWKRRDRTSQGITFTSKKILQYAVILLGFGLNLAEVVRVGAQSLPVIISTIATALIVAFVLCKALHIPERIATLVGVGSSICGGSAIAAVTFLKQYGANNIKFMCIIAAPEGLNRLHEAHPDVEIFCAALDKQLNDHGYIMPGLGDAGDRIYGTK